MIEKIKKYFFRVKHYFQTFSIWKKQKTIDKYKKLQKELQKSAQLKENKRQKYNIQLNLNLHSKYIKKIFIWVFFLIIIIIIIIFKWPFLKIQKINVIKLNENVNVALIEKNLDFLKWEVLFNINSTNIEDTIKNIEQNIENVDITKIFPNTLRIKLSSFEAIYKTTFNWNKYLITKNWVFIPTKNKNDQYTDIIIKNLELENYPNYKKILDIDNLEKINYLETKLKDNILNIKLENIYYYKTEREIHFIINNKTRLIFDLEWNIDENLKQLFVFNKEKVDITKPWIIYIDNRIQSKILYCEEVEINTCLQNLNYIYDEKLKISDYKTKIIKK